jgi:hypothetical protein
LIDPASIEVSGGRVSISTPHGAVGIVDPSASREPVHRQQAVNAGLLHPHTVVPGLRGRHDPGTHDLGCIVFASPAGEARVVVPEMAPGAIALLDRIAAEGLG